MVKVKPTANQGRITVKTSNDTNIFSIKDNLSEYYAKQSENWAHSEGIVNGIDYSSKYYAEQSKASAQVANEAKTVAQELIESFDNNVQIAKDDIEQNKINSINAIDNTYSVAVGDMHEKSDEVLTSIEVSKAEAIDSINSTKTTILNDIEFVADGEKQEIQELADEIKNSGNTVNTAIEAGVERLNSIDALKKSQITNCITKMPQTVKYEFEYGTLTIKAGTIGIFPYGTKDLSSQFPVGSTFLKSTLKVVDTYYTNNKFFVRAELQKDITATAETTSTGQRLLCIRTDSGNLSSGWLTGTSGASVGTDPTGFTGQFYNTDSNIVSYIKDGAILGEQTNISLPILVYSSDGVQQFAKVDQAYNGIGRMGNMYWLDKGAEGLSANGHNPDESIKNIKFVNNKFLWATTTNKNHKNNLWLRNLDSTPTLSNFYAEFFHTIRNRSELPLATVEPYQVYYIEEEAIWVYNGTTGTWNITPSIILGNNYLNSVSQIEDFNPKKPFQAVDFNEFIQYPKIITVYTNGNSGYIIWSNGYCEQWGQTQALQVDFLIPYINANYWVNCTIIGAAATLSNSGHFFATSKMATFMTRAHDNFSVNWRTGGYIKKIRR